mmetsp:Transcript_21944/g.36351  ORF Transcript_21944/g.36351 Transcript_21944/m.36351 type:complete len:247 (+) Transcript_21944:18-758(+)
MESEAKTTRKDGRNANQLRPLSAEQGFLNHPDGSARFLQGSTSIIAAVYGPAKTQTRKELLDRAAIEVIVKSKSGIPGPFERDLEHSLRRSIEVIAISKLFPRTGITVILQIVHDDGALVSTAFNAACLALMDAGVPISTTMSSATCAVTAQGQLLLDPILAEEKDCSGVLTFVFDNSIDPLAGVPLSKGVLCVHTTGVFIEEAYFAAMDVTANACARVQAFVRKSLELKLKQQLGHQQDEIGRSA